MSEKYSAEIKIQAVLEYLDGRNTKTAICKRLGIHYRSFQKWIMKYQAMGEAAFTNNAARQYSAELKEHAVNDYLLGKESSLEICKKYCISSPTQLFNWIKKYNSHMDFNSSETGGTVDMTKGRTTTFNERVEIAKYCITHNNNYAEAAEKYSVSYNQARNYTIKYEKDGDQGLHDNRGKRKPADKLSEIEKLRAELKLEKEKRIKAEMEASFLKKLDEIERRRG